MASDLGIDLGISNPIAYAHMQLRGGWKNLAITGSAYALAVGVFIFVTIRYNPPAMATTLSVWASILLGIQSALLCFGGCSTVNTAIRTDTTSQMMESHRLLPISPASAVLGYLIGAPCQMFFLALITFVIGWACSIGASLPPGRWPVANAILLVFSVFLWTGIVFFALSVKNGVKWYFGTLIGILTSQGIVLALLPAIAVLASPLMRSTIYDARAWNSQINTEYALAIAAQTVMGAIFFTGAARRFRRPDRPAMGSILALILLATWVGLSWLGISRWDEIRPLFSPSDMGPAPFIASMAASLLIAILPVSSANWAESEWRQHKLADDPALARRPLPPLLVPFLAAALILPLTWLAAEAMDTSLRDGRLRTGLCMALFLLAISYLQRMMYRVKARAALLTGAFVVLVWLGPFVADTVRYAMSAERHPPTLTWISTVSPVGMLICLWVPDHRAPIDTTPGLIVLASLAAFAAALFYRPLLFKNQK